MKLLREPLLHFLLIGAAFFLVYGLFSQPASGVADRTITVSSQKIEWLKSTWEQRWNRPPTPEELDGLIKSYVREIVLYREALALGLDKDDTIIRRRLGTKMEYLVTDILAMTPPTNDQLEAYFDKNREQYREPTRYSFTQVFFDPDKRGRNTLEDAEAVKARLVAAGDEIQDPGALGDGLMLENYHVDRAKFEIQGLFGDSFAQSLVVMSPGQWHGPVPSGYGVHLVFIHQIIEPPQPAFEDLRDKLAQAWTMEKTQELKQEFFDNLYEQYTIVIEQSPPGSGILPAAQ